MDEKKRTPCEPGQLQDVSTCTVDYDKQDGYHSRPIWLGYDEKEHPGWQSRYAGAFHNLFSNWHPGLLGHQTMGLQLTYRYSELLLEALKLLIEEVNTNPNPNPDALTITLILG